jgi:hypothetical protein
MQQQQDALRSIDADLHQVRRSIQQHAGGGGSRQSNKQQQQVQMQETDGAAFAELQRKWS